MREVRAGGVAELLAEYVADVAFGTSFLALGEEESAGARRPR